MLVFLVEELSMADFLDELLPRLFPKLCFKCVPHEGKSDLERRVPQILRAWRTPNTRFVVMRDQNGGDCRQVKAKLRALCERGGRPDSLVRVVCRELEAWYVGDQGALAKALPNSAGRIRRSLGRSRFRDPDAVVHPANALSELIPAFQKRAGAKAMGKLLSHKNSSRSYQVFLEGVERLRSESVARVVP